MKFETALGLMNQHIKIRRKFWKPDEYIWVKPGGEAIITEKGKRYDVNAIEILKEDWERYKGASK